MIRDTFWADTRISATARGIAAFVEEHPNGARLDIILSSFRDTPLRLAYALDELEAAGYLRRVGDTPDWPEIYYTATTALREVAA